MRQLRKQIEIDDLKYSVDKKNLLSQFIIERESFYAEKEVLSKAVRTQEDKAKYWSQENRKKDEFVKKYLLDRVKAPEDSAFIREFFSRFEQELARPEEYD